jgi:D-sedoheptulose 7-phosphate isomerase
MRDTRVRPDYTVRDLGEAVHLIEHLLASKVPEQTRLISAESGAWVQSYLKQSAEVTLRVAEELVPAILRGADLIAGTFRRGGKILLCGNGGSAADCQHMATEFVSRLTKELDRPALPALALTTDTSFLTAYANDVDFAGVFERQVRALGRPGDLLVGISTSGRSTNVLRAIETASAMGLRTLALTGREGLLGTLADVTIAVPSGDTQHVQESHLAIEHALCYLVERELYPESLGGRP